MGACGTTPHTSAGNQHATPDNPIATGPFLALNDLPPLAGVKLVRPRRCAAAGAPALPPGRAAGRPRAAARKDLEEQSAQPGGVRSHRARSVCPLDTGGPYGCRIPGGWWAGAFRWSTLHCSIQLVPVVRLSRVTPERVISWNLDQDDPDAVGVLDV